LNDIYLQRVSLNGERLWTQDLKVSREPGNRGRYAPFLASHGSEFRVAWDESRLTPGKTDIYVQSIDANGNVLWNQDVRIGQDLQQDQFGPVLAVDTNGETTVVWSDHRTGSGGLESDGPGILYAQRLSNSGSSLWANDVMLVSQVQYRMPSGAAESKRINVNNSNIIRATLTATAQENNGSIDYFLSNDGGATWQKAIPGQPVTFSASGADLRWRVELQYDPIKLQSPELDLIHLEYENQVTNDDAFEPDDLCSQARPVAVNGVSQSHNFKLQGDVDWVWFDVTSETTYLIQTFNEQARADLLLELHAECPQPPVALDDNTFGRSARITWQAGFSGRVRLKISNKNPAGYGVDTGYELLVRTYSQSPIAMIVAGHDDTYRLQANINAMGDMAYKTFLNSGISKANLRYLSPNLDRDVDGNGIKDDIAGLPTPSNVRNAIQDWSRNRGVGPGIPFYLFLVDHGGVDQFLSDGVNGKILATDLDLWLSNLEATSGADHLNIVLEACNSGSFIDANALGPAEISAHNRVVIASTSSTLNAYPSQEGGIFSDLFWTAIGQSQDLERAFINAQSAVIATGLSQEPWLDDNGDAVANAQDGQLASTRGLGASFNGYPPVIDSVEIGAFANGEATITAQVRDDFDLSQVEVMIYPPDFVEPPTSTDGTTPILDVPRLKLAGLGGDRYSTSYSSFTQSGQYRLVVYAQDADGNQAFPVTAYFSPGGSTAHSLFMPVLLNRR
jgi:hypothetical protein